MKCTNHPRVEAAASCAECGKHFCSACKVDLDHRAWCRDCLSRILSGRGAGSRVHPGWRKLTAGLLSIVPGAGHMFLGLIGKGFTLMGLLIVAVFFVLIYSDATGMYWMTAYLIPTIGVLFLSYAVFDSMAIAESQRSGREATGADDDAMKIMWERVLLNRHTLGWVILLAGAVGILRLFADPFSRWTMEMFAVSFPLAALVIPVVLIVMGILLLKRSRKDR